MESRSSSGIEILARLGYVAKGIVYLGVATLTVLSVVSEGSADAQGSRDAVLAIGRSAWGVFLLGAVAVGLAGYVSWRLVEALVDPEERGTDLKGLATRGVLFVSALGYGSLCLWIVRGLLDGGAPAKEGSTGGSWSATLLEAPFGAWLLGIVGLAVLAYGVAEWVKAANADFEKRMRPGIDGRRRRWLRRFARAGLVSRGVVFGVIGGFVVHAAATADPSQTRGLEGALQALANSPAGPPLMAAVAAGLAGYGVLQMAKAWYRRIDVEIA